MCSVSLNSFPYTAAVYCCWGQNIELDEWELLKKPSFSSFTFVPVISKACIAVLMNKFKCEYLREESFFLNK